MRGYDTGGKELSTNSYNIPGYKETGNVLSRVRPADYDTNFSYVENPQWSNDSRYLTATFTLKSADNRRDLHLINLTTLEVLNIVAGPHSVGESSAWIGEGAVGPPDAVVVADPTRGVAPLTVSFSGHQSGGSPADYTWSFGDGEGATGVNASHTYTNPGSFSAKLVVSNKNGYDSTQVEIIVDEHQALPDRIEIRPSEPVFVTCGRGQQFSATVFDDFGNEIPDALTTWSVRGKGGSTITEEGLFRAGGFEMVCDTVVASSGGIEKRRIVNLRPEPMLLVTAMGERTCTVGDAIEIEYRYDPLVVTRPVVEFSPNSGINWVAIDADTAGADPGDGILTKEFTWVIPSSIAIPGGNQSLSTVSPNCRMRIYDYHQNVDPVICEKAFAIIEENVALLERMDGKCEEKLRVTVLRNGLSIQLPSLHDPVLIRIVDTKGRRHYEQKTVTNVRIDLAVPEILLIEIRSLGGDILQRRLISGAILK